VKKTLLIVVGVLFIASLAYAQPGRIQLFSDPTPQGCDLTDDGVFFVWVYHINTNATASQFSVILGSGASGITLLGATSPHPTVIGDVQTGVAVAYGSCLGSTGPIELFQLMYNGTNQSAPCSQLLATDDPTATPPGIYVVDCILPTPNKLVAAGSVAHFNNNGTCPCVPAIPVEETSWGQIKALYQ
jgi:hypothetical protein